MKSESSQRVNQSSIDRGLFRSDFYRTYTASEDEKENQMKEVICKPEGKYELLDDDGIVSPGLAVSGDDIIIGKIVQTEDKKVKKDCSVRLKPGESGRVEQVMLTTHLDGRKLVKVKIRSVKTPQIGDKFASLHGLKGVIGMTYPQEDMPFTIDSIVPDVIINPHAIPSKMPIGQLIECLANKTALLAGRDWVDATPFQSNAAKTVENISAELHSFGYQFRGNEVMYNPHTGVRMTAQIFMGSTYYQKLKHLVDDKIRVRNTGPKDFLTRQPTEGRNKYGGARVGEMERDCLIAHGVSQILQERLFTVSDFYNVHVCEQCGLTAVANLKENEFKCNRCSNLGDPDGTNRNPKIVQVYLPYACKLLFQELMAMSIAPRILTTSEKEY